MCDTRSSHRPRGSSWCQEALRASGPFLFCDGSGASWLCSDRQESRTWEGGSFLGPQHRSLLLLGLLHPGPVVQLVHKLEAPRLGGLGSVLLGAASSEGPSGLDFPAWPACVQSVSG